MSSETGDRATWGSQVEFILTCVGCAVGLGNVWRFPYLAYRNGGGAFLLPYFLSLFLLGIPLFALDINLGQFSSRGPLVVWRLSPVFRDRIISNILSLGAGTNAIGLLFMESSNPVQRSCLSVTMSIQISETIFQRAMGPFYEAILTLRRRLGVAMITVTSFIMIYYSVVIAQFVYFLFASMTSELPWGSCLHEWNTCACRIDANDTSYINNTHINCTDIFTMANETSSPSEEYYNYEVLEVSDGIGNAGKLKWQLVLCNLLSWSVCCIIIIKGIKSLGKAIYVFTILPYILLTVMLVRGLTLDGYKKGVDYYITPKPEVLSDASVWGDAAVQIFFSTSTCSGALIAMASYNKFHNNTLRDAILIPLINCLTSFFAGFAIFSVLGFMAEAKHVDVADVTTQGPGLVFVVYPEALSKMPIPPLWSILFFIMLVTLGWSSMISGVESVLTAFIDVFPNLGKGKTNYIFRMCACLLGFLLGLPQVTQGGSYVLNLMDTFVGGFPLLLIGLVELIAVMYCYGDLHATIFVRLQQEPVYGFKNRLTSTLMFVAPIYKVILTLQDDIRMMLGFDMNIVASIVYYYLLMCWGFLSPVLLVAAIVFKSIQYTPITGPGYPEWSEALGWLMVAAIVIAIPVWFIIYYCYRGGLGVLREASRPLPDWGPMLGENRSGRYSSWFHSPSGAMPNVLDNKPGNTNGSAVVGTVYTMTGVVDSKQDGTGMGIINTGYVPHAETEEKTKF